MPDPSLTLISHPLCPFVQRAAIVLLEKNAPFERINVDLSAKPDWFLALSPTGKVPLLNVHQTDDEDAIPARKARHAAERGMDEHPALAICYDTSWAPRRPEQ